VVGRPVTSVIATPRGRATVDINRHATSSNSVITAQKRRGQRLIECDQALAVEGLLRVLARRGCRLRRRSLPGWLISVGAININIARQ
jgi:hypothetical protein